MSSGKRKEPSDIADGKSESVDEKGEASYVNIEETVLDPYSISSGRYGIDDFGFHLGKQKEPSDSADGKSESVDEKGEAFYVNMEEKVLGPYSIAAGEYGIDDFGFHLYYTFMKRPQLTEQEAAFMERYRLYQDHLQKLKKECIEGINSSDAGKDAESERKAKIARTDAGGEAGRNFDLIISNALAEMDKKNNANRVAQGLPEKTSKDNSDQEVHVDSDGDCEIVEDKSSVPQHGGQGGAA